ncbi:unnamed protein product [Allacma fusca]|uniref:Uncharacterized protein n=1 Tax=Allacma fusca TaxID=39272 RepID=A0A8J2K2D3_9HEXA|nr:unnamed protein product [Allacma fusca]
MGGGGDAPELISDRRSRPMTSDDPCDFISQRSSSVNSESSKISKPPTATTATSESDDDFESSCEVSARSGDCPQLKSLSEIQVSARKSDVNSAVIESIFNKWKHRQASLDIQEDLSKEETTPRRKELLIQKLKEIDANHKKVEDIVPLTNPAYFPVESDPSVAVKTSEKTEPVEIPKKMVMKSQHSSILEPRHSLPPTVSNSVEAGKFKETEAQEDLPRKKFTIGTISSSSQSGTVQPTSIHKKPTSTKSKPGRGGWK